MSKLHHDAHELINEWGAQQGCAFGTLLYCGGILPTLCELIDGFKDCLILCIVDDINILGPPLFAARCFAKLIESAGHDGETMKLSKCHFFSHDPSTMRLFGLPGERHCGAELQQKDRLHDLVPEGVVRHPSRGLGNSSDKREHAGVIVL